MLGIKIGKGIVLYIILWNILAYDNGIMVIMKTFLRIRSFILSTYGWNIVMSTIYLPTI